MDTKIVEKVLLVEKSVLRALESKKKQLESSVSECIQKQDAEYASKVKQAVENAEQLVKGAVSAAEKEVKKTASQSSSEVAKLRERFSKNKDSIVDKAMSVLVR